MPNIGETIICSETGRAFVVATDGCSFNYARDKDGNLLSDEGVDIRERRELLNRAAPFVCYLSSDGNNVTGWKGNKLGEVIRSRHCELTRQSCTHSRASFRSVRVRDVHGGEWYGRGSPGIAIVLRACKEPLTAVVFRVWKGGDVLALFPHMEEGRGMCGSYEHIGQHGAANYAACIAQTRPANPEEFAPLKMELESIGYRLRIISRCGGAK
jgi:hypothetical protein